MLKRRRLEKLFPLPLSDRDYTMAGIFGPLFILLSLVCTRLILQAALPIFEKALYLAWMVFALWFGCAATKAAIQETIRRWKQWKAQKAGDE